MMMPEKISNRFYATWTEQNLKLLKQAIDLRYELAQLFGKASYADWALKDRMAKHQKL